MRKNLAFALIAGVMLMLAAGCSKGYVAEVNGEKITKKEYESALKMRMGAHAQRGVSVEEKAIRAAVMDELIASRLIAQTAKERKITVGEKDLDAEIKNAEAMFGGKKEFRAYLKKSGIAYEAFRKDLKKTLLANRLLEELAPSGTVTDEEVRDFYENSPTPFLKAERVNVRFVQTATLEEAQKIYDGMKKDTAGFDAAAEKLTGDGKRIVSEYGWTEPGFFSDEIGKALKNLKKGSVGGPYKGKDGFFIISLKDREPAGVKSLEEAKEEIRGIIASQKKEMLLGHIIGEKKNTSKIKVLITI